MTVNSISDLVATSISTRILTEDSSRAINCLLFMRLYDEKDLAALDRLMNALDSEHVHTEGSLVFLDTVNLSEQLSS